MKFQITIAFILAFFLVSCAPIVEPNSTLVSASITPPPIKTIKPTHAPETNVPSLQNTPNVSASPDVAPSNIPWTPLQKDNVGDWVYRCEVNHVSFEVVEILPKIEATGFLICDKYKIPVGIYDKNNNSLYYWGLLPIQNPTIVDYLGERGIERFIVVFGFGETYLDSDKLIGLQLSMSINLPNSQNGSGFDTQNIGRFASDYWASQDVVDMFAKTGILSNSDNILYPISLGVIR